MFKCHLAFASAERDVRRWFGSRVGHDCADGIVFNLDGTISGFDITDESEALVVWAFDAFDPASALAPLNAELLELRADLPPQYAELLERLVYEAASGAPEFGLWALRSLGLREFGSTNGSVLADHLDALEESSALRAVTNGASASRNPARL